MYIFRKNLCVKMMICRTADRGLNGDWTNKRLQGKEIDSVEVCPDKYPIKPFPLCPHLGLKEYRVDVCTGRRPKTTAKTMHITRTERLQEYVLFPSLTNLCEHKQPSVTTLSSLFC
jgi:hypothetical protein